MKSAIFDNSYVENYWLKLSLLFWKNIYHAQVSFDIYTIFEGYYNYTDAVKKNTDAILRIQDDQKQMSARFNSRIKIIYTTVEKKGKDIIK